MIKILYLVTMLISLSFSRLHEDSLELTLSTENLIDSAKDVVDNILIDNINLGGNSFGYSPFFVKMPYINSNRTIFCSSDADLIDLLLLENKYLLASYNMVEKIIKFRISEFVETLRIVFNDEEELDIMLNNENEPILVGFYEEKDVSVCKTKLKAELLDLKNMLKSEINSSISRERLTKFLQSIEDYVFEYSIKNFFIFQIIPTIALGTNLEKTYYDFQEVKSFIDAVVCLYMYISYNISNYKHIFYSLEAQSVSLYTSCSMVLKDNILAKLMFDEGKTYIAYYLNMSKYQVKFNMLMIYSFNANSLAEKLANIIDIIIGDKIDDTFDKYYLQEIVVPNTLFQEHKFVSFEAIISNKRYIFKKFNLVKVCNLPSGISTAYLNINSNFESLGYVGVRSDSIKYLFVSVEESLDCYIITNKLHIFEENHDQIIYFVRDILYIIHEVNIHRISLLDYGIVIAVDTKGKIWRFRLDDIGNFNYVKSKVLFMNHTFTIDIINRVLPYIKNYNLVVLFTKLLALATDLKFIKDPNYLIKLVEMIEQYLAGIDDIPYIKPISASLLR